MSNLSLSILRTLVLICCLSAASQLAAQNTVTGTLVSGGLTREYILYVPAIYTGNVAVPLIFNLHGYGSNNLEQLFYGDFRPIADTANFLMVLPNGTLDDQNRRFWNTFLGNATVDDVAFIRDLLDTLQANYNIDANRVYSTGMSNGGFMSYSLACDLNDRITAIASVTGTMIQSKLNACNPARPVPVMEIHGTSDNVVPYNGQAGSTFVGIPALMSAWAGFNQCNPNPVITQVPNTNTNDGCTAERQLYFGGDWGSTVEHFKIVGGGHTWPGAAFNVGVTNQDISASKEIWRFFQQYNLNQFTATTQVPFTPEWSVYPNPVTDYLTLQSNNQQALKIVRVYDGTGRLIQSIAPSADAEIRIQTSTWLSGLYMLELKGTGRAQWLKVVKE